MTEKGARLRFAVKSEPFHGEPENADAFYAAAGRFLMLWGRFETALDSTLQCILLMEGGETYLRSSGDRFPREMRRKAAVWRAAFKGMAALAPWRAEALKIMTTATALHRNRTILVHAMWAGFEPGEPLAVRLMLRRYDGAQVTLWKHRVELTDLLDSVEKCDRLNTRALPIIWNVNSLYWRSTGDRKS
jgi:hypothetical protein